MPLDGARDGTLLFLYGELIILFVLRLWRRRTAKPSPPLLHLHLSECLTVDA